MLVRRVDELRLGAALRDERSARGVLPVLGLTSKYFRLIVRIFPTSLGPSSPSVGAACWSPVGVKDFFRWKNVLL